jgi:hypothetical protein
MSKWKWIIISIVVAGTSVFFGMVSKQIELARLVYTKVMKNELDISLNKAQEPTVLEVGMTETTYHLIEGWNFVSFPLNPASFDTAAGLIIDVAKKGGYVTVVSAWDGDGWIEFAQREDRKYGQDFEIVPGKAYFLRSHLEIDWRIVGDELEPIKEYQFKEGWNTIGFVGKEAKAKEVIDDINQGQEKATVIDWWTTGSQWELFIKRYLAEGDVREYGENFSIEGQKGYMILVNQDLDWRLDEAE